MSLVRRADKVAFYQVPSSNCVKLTGFTSMSTSKNPKEYTRQYVDEAFEQSDVIAYSPSIEYAFDQDTSNLAHTDIVAISDGEITGTGAVRDIVLVDFTKASGGGYVATKRSFSVIPDTEGDSTDAYTYSGSFKTKSATIVGVATSADNFQTITFTPDTGAEYLATFNVSDTNGQVSGAQITINNTILSTDTNGIASTNLSAGTYAYSIISTGHTTATGNITVTASAVYTEVTLVIS